MDERENPEEIIHRLTPERRAAILRAKADLLERLATIDREAQPFAWSRIQTRRLTHEAVTDWSDVTFVNLFFGLCEASTESKEAIVSEAKKYLIDKFPDGELRQIVEHTVNQRLIAWAAAVAASEATTEQEPRTEKPPKENGRKEQVQTFLNWVLYKTGRKVTRAEFAALAGYNDLTEFYRWQRNDPKKNDAAQRAFERLLDLTPDQFITELDKRNPPKT